MYEYIHFFTIKSLTLFTSINILCEANNIFRKASESLLSGKHIGKLGQMAGLQSISENHCNGMGEKVLYGRVL